VDHLEQVNQEYGRAIGDRLLRRLIRVLREGLPENVLLGHWRGGQFLFFFQGTEPPMAAKHMQEILGSFRRERFDTGNSRELTASFSAGLTGCVDDWTLERAVDESERILYLAKAAGRACVLSEPGDGPPRQPGTLKILMAEEDPTMVVLVKYRLEREHFTVHHFSTGKAALDAALGGDYDLILSALHLPEMDGFEFLTHLRKEKRYGKVPFIMVTSLSEESNVVRAFQLGADDYITKPFSTYELAARIHRLLHKPV